MKMGLLQVRGVAPVHLLAKKEVTLINIFDVGANIGQSLCAFRKHFPTTPTYCFEPSPASFATLIERHSHDQNANHYPLALSRSSGTAAMKIVGSSVNNSIVSLHLENAPDDNHIHAVETVTGDSFIEKHSMNGISFLKIDTEGHDMDVLIGFINNIKDQRIDYIQVESSMSPYNRKHISFSSFCEFFDAFDYRLVGVFEQAFDRRSGRLRRANLLFCSQLGAKAIANGP